MSAPEFSRPILLARLGNIPLRQEITASETERAALAKRFGLLALDRLSASVELIRRGGDMILLRASFAAEVVQECVATLDPVPGLLADAFELLYGPPESEEVAMGVVGDEVAFEPLSGQIIDIGEAVAQEVSLALPPFPRSVDAPVDTAAPPDDASPFAALARLLDRSGGKTE